MDDREKSREQLLRELAELRARLQALEGQQQRREAPTPAEAGISEVTGESTALSAAAEGHPMTTGDVDSDTAAALLRCSPAAIVVVDREGRVILWSAAAEHLFGWSEEEVLGKPNPLVPEAEVADFERSLARELEGESVSEVIYQRRRRDGTLLDVHLATAPLRDNQGRAIGVIGLFTPAEHALSMTPTAADIGRVFDSVHDGVWMLDREGVTTFVNRRMAEMIGYRVQEIVGRPAHAFVSSDARDRVKEMLRRREEGVAEHYEIWLPHKHDGGVWCAVSGAPLYDRAGEYVGAVATVKDITSRKQSEQMLEERFRLIAENATDLICRHAPDGRYLYVSPSCRKLLGYEPEEMLGHSPYEFFHPDDAERIRDIHDRTLDSSEASAIEYRMCRRDGTDVWLETVSKAIRSERTGEVVEIHTTSRNVTSRREAEYQLHLVKCAVEQIDEMVVITDADLGRPGPRIEYVNAAFCETTGYTLEEVVGRTPRLLQGPRTSREVLDRLHRQLSRGENFEGETYNYRKDGSEFILHWHIAPVRDESGRITHWVAIQRDVTEQRRTEALARQRQSELAHVGRLSTMGEMASGLAHELNQPLAAIVIYVQGCLHRMEQSGMEPHELVEALQCVKDQAFRASEIIRRLRDFVRKHEPQRGPADLNYLLREVLGLMDLEIQRHNVRLQLDLDKELPSVMVDGVQVEQVILNLVRNAIEAMEENPPADRPLTIRTVRQNDEHAVISVRDAGVGMTDDQLDRIFKPFFTTKEKGMGMGLNISQTIAHANEGRLWAERNPDRGMSFHLRLPLVQ